jgi:hypothetical protein
MNMRGKWAEAPPNTTKINVTSAQATASRFRQAFSPMTEIPGGYKGYWNFESYWQAGKVYEGISHEITDKWWKALKEPKRRFPNSKGKKVLYAVFDDYKEEMNYVQSRKIVYVPEYFELIKEKEVAQQLKRVAQDVVVYDFDGPRGDDGVPICLEVTREMLVEKINDTRFPFGHGYVVAAWLAGLEPTDYIN